MNIRSTLLYATAIGISLLSSCKKDEKTEGEANSGEKYPIAINVENFTQSSSPIAAVSTDKTTLDTKKQTAVTTYYYTRLMFIVYDSNGKQVSRLDQSLAYNLGKNLYRISDNKKVLVNNNAFGSITDTLAGGNYTLVVAGCSPNAGLNRPSDGVVNSVYSELYPTADYSSATLYPSWLFSTEQTFLYKGTLTVNNLMTPQVIVPKRITGQIILNIEDPMPANVSYITYYAKNNYTYIKVNNNEIMSKMPDNLVAGYHLKPEEIGRSNFQITWNILNTVSPLEVSISAFDKLGNLIATKTINNVSVKANEKTTVTGKLFNPNPSIFTVNVDQDWGAGSMVKF